MKKHIPNIITLLNLVSGACACMMALWGQYQGAFLFILAAACFDFLDGFFARLLHAYSDIGKELDSLCDLVSFGLAPSLMFVNWYLNAGHTVTALAYVALIIAAFSALRLAKFNLDSRQSVNFIGLPTPSAAMMISGFTAYAHMCKIMPVVSKATWLMNTTWFIPTVSIVTALLLVSEIPMFSLKKKKISFRTAPTEALFFVTAAVILVICIIFRRKGLGFFNGILPLAMSISFVAYILMNIVALPATKRNCNERLEKDPQEI